MDRPTGGCLCGRARLVAAGSPDRVGICRCLARRKQGGALFNTATFARDAVTITGETHEYSGRHFCPRYASCVFAGTGYEIEVHSGALNAPDRPTPSHECRAVRRAAWLPPFPTGRQYDRDRDAKDQFER